MTSTSTELVWVPKTTLDLVHLPGESRRDRRERERHQRRSRTKLMAACSATAILATMIAAAIVNQPPGVAAAGEAEPVVTTVAPPAPEPIAPLETIPPTTAATGYRSVKVVTSTGDHLAQLVTDGRYTDKILPGEHGVSVLSANVDLTNDRVVWVEGEAWRIHKRGTVEAKDVSPLIIEPVVPVVILLSGKPGDIRPYVELRQK